MPRLSTLASTFAATWLLPTLALAQEHAPTAAHEEVGAFPTAAQGVASAVTALIVFAIVFAVLAAKVWPVISKALDDRAGKIKGEIEAAEAARAQAKAALAQYEKNLADARAEAQKMLDETKAQQTALAAELRAKADAELSALRDKARRDIEAAKRAALKEIYDTTGELATKVAGKILQREINAGDQSRLVQESLGQLKGIGTNN